MTTFLNCSHKKEERQFAKEKVLSEYKMTEFLPTLDNELTIGKNSVYCATMLFAWDEVRKIIRTPIQIDSKFSDLTILNSSNKYIGVLKPEEFSVEGKVSYDSLIEATAEFKKSLPFEYKLSSFKDRLFFDNIKVASFGSDGDNSKISIIYYKNDNDFIIKLLPKDAEHEIILYKPGILYKSMTQILTDIDRKINEGQIDIQKEESSWKYNIENEDEVVIPKLNFNISTNYASLEGNHFKSNKIEFHIKKARQTTAFLLDEFGAEIVSVGGVEVIAEIGIKPEKKQIKKMIFDKPFFLLLKRTHTKYPYFGLWITNTELMVQE